jgi:hypothetical protein
MDGKPEVEVLEAKIVNAGAGTVVLAGDETSHGYQLDHPSRCPIG